MLVRGRGSGDGGQGRDGPLAPDPRPPTPSLVPGPQPLTPSLVAGPWPLAPSIMVAPWPVPSGARDEEADARMTTVIDLVHGVRNLRAEYRVDPGRWVPATIVAEEGDVDFYRSVAAVIGDLPGSRLRPIEVVDRLEATMERAATVVAGRVALYVPLAGMVDIPRERARLEREREDALAEIDRAETLLSRPGFVEKARADVVDRERQKLAGLRGRLAKLDERLAALA